jgi:diadenosine tetraphosphate (Ap4A) HIT family hydrolase
VQVLAAVAPAADVDASDLADRPQSALDSGQQDAELCGQAVGEVARLADVVARLEEDDDGEPGRLVQTAHAPALVRPQIVVVGRRAGMAVDAALAVTRLLALDRWTQRPRLHLTVERERVPRLDGRHAQGACDACVQLFGRLGHCSLDGNVAAVEWPSSFYALRRGDGCEMCRQGRPDETKWGVRILAGEVSDAYLQKAGIQRGYSIVVWRGRHVAEPTELSTDEAAAYWLEVLRAARALETHFEPVKMNYDLLGNSLPHLHMHVLPRYGDDPSRAGRFPSPSTTRRRTRKASSAPTSRR